MLQQDRLPVQVTILQQVAVQVPVLAITVALRAARVLVTAGHPVVQVPVLVTAGHLAAVRAHVQVIVVDQPIVLLPEVHIAQAHHLPAAVHPEVEEAVAGEAEADADKKAR